MTAVHLRRIDATRNMRRFSRLDVQPDFFGGVLLVKQWEPFRDCLPLCCQNRVNTMRSKLAELNGMPSHCLTASAVPNRNTDGRIIFMSSPWRRN
jgi:hypothetical protein